MLTLEVFPRNYVNIALNVFKVNLGEIIVPLFNFEVPKKDRKLLRSLFTKLFNLILRNEEVLFKGGTIHE